MRVASNEYASNNGCHYRFRNNLIRLSALSIAFAMATVTVTVVTPPAFAQDAAEKTLAQRIAEQEQRAQKGSGNKAATTAGGFFGAAVALGCAVATAKAGELAQLGCVAAGALSGYGATLLGKQIAKKLANDERKKLLLAASESLRSGEPQSLDFPDSNQTASVTPGATPIFKEEEVDVFYDSARLEKLTRVKILAESFSSSRPLDVYSSAEDGAKSVGKIKRDQAFFVAGQVENAPWYMVSERVVEGDAEAFMVVGYVKADSLSASGKPADLPAAPPPVGITEGRVTAVLKCNELEFVVRGQDGRDTKSKSSQCLGPEGKLLSA